MKKVKPILIIICLMALPISVFRERISLIVKLILFIVYFLLLIFIFMKEKKYKTFSKKITNVLYCLAYTGFIITTCFLAFFDTPNSSFIVVEVLVTLSYFGFEIAAEILDY